MNIYDFLRKRVCSVTVNIWNYLTKTIELTSIFNVVESKVFYNIMIYEMANCEWQFCQCSMNQNLEVTCTQEVILCKCHFHYKISYGWMDNRMGKPSPVYTENVNVGLLLAWQH